jgi:anti-sigma factor RsiW
MHMDEGVLQAIVDDELPDTRRRDADRHLAVCERCSGELHSMRQAREELSAALRLVDSPAPMLAARVRIQKEARRRKLLGGTVVLRRAALFLVASAAVLSATVPGSPVRSWLSGAWHYAAGPVEHSPEPTLASAEAEVHQTGAPAGVSLVPSAGRVRVIVSSPAPGLAIQVRFQDSDRLGVWASGPAATARFLTAPDRVEVEAPGAGELLIEIPHAAVDVLVEVAGQPYLVKEGDRLRFPGPRAERSGPQIRFEVGP